MNKTLLIMGLAVLAGVVGDLFLSVGMKDLGDVSGLTFKTAGSFILKVMGCPKIWVGTFFLALFFFLWLTVLSWAELSFVLPLQAATFILGPMLAQIFLGEQANPLRWFGTVLISIGVVLVSLKS